MSVMQMEAASCWVAWSSIGMCMRCRVPPCVPQTSSPLAIDNHHTCRSLPHSSAMPSICSRPGACTQGNNTKTRMEDLVRPSGRMPRRQHKAQGTTAAQGTRHCRKVDGLACLQCGLSARPGCRCCSDARSSELCER